MSRSLATNAGSLESLKVRTRCGRSLCARQILSTELGLIPTAAAMAAAMAAAVQWVASRGGLARRLGRGQLDHAVDHGLRQGRDARGPGLVAQQAGHALADEPLPPAPDARLALAGPPHDLGGAVAVRRGQDDRSSPARRASAGCSGPPRPPPDGRGPWRSARSRSLRASPGCRSPKGTLR